MQDTFRTQVIGSRIEYPVYSNTSGKKAIYHVTYAAVFKLRSIKRIEKIRRKKTKGICFGSRKTAAYNTLYAAAHKLKNNKAMSVLVPLFCSSVCYLC